MKKFILLLLIVFLEPSLVWGDYYDLVYMRKYSQNDSDYCIDSIHRLTNAVGLPYITVGSHAIHYPHGVSGIPVLQEPYKYSAWKSSDSQGNQIDLPTTFIASFRDKIFYFEYQKYLRRNLSSEQYDEWISENLKESTTIRVLLPYTKTSGYLSLGGYHHDDILSVEIDFKEQSNNQVLLFLEDNTSSDFNTKPTHIELPYLSISRQQLGVTIKLCYGTFQDIAKSFLCSCSENHVMPLVLEGDNFTLYYIKDYNNVYYENEKIEFKRPSDTKIPLTCLPVVDKGDQPRVVVKIRQLNDRVLKDDLVIVSPWMSSLVNTTLFVLYKRNSTGTSNAFQVLLRLKDNNETILLKSENTTLLDDVILSKVHVLVPGLWIREKRIELEAGKNVHIINIWEADDGKPIILEDRDCSFVDVKVALIEPKPVNGNASECFNGGVLNEEYKICHCPQGYTGNSCETFCGENKFGKECTGRCSTDGTGCKGVELCSNDFLCLCAPGFTGRECLKTCDKGHYGANCEQNCIGKCYADEACSPFSGECQNEWFYRLRDFIKYYISPVNEVLLIYNLIMIGIYITLRYVVYYAKKSLQLFQ